MRKLAALFVFALFAGCASANNDPDSARLGRPDGDGERGGEAGASGTNGSKGGAAGKLAQGGEAGIAGTSSSSGAGGDDGGAAGSPAGGTGGTGGGAGKGGAAGGPNPCAGVACNAPPAKTCASATELEVFSGPGSCSEGDCTYASSKITCDKGCKDDVCVGNACLGVSCNAPPAPSCIGAQDLLAFDPGSCSEGKCTYPDKKIFCQFGCEKGACKGNPCSGKICGQPPASYCSAADKLSVFESIGKCDNVTGDCTYAKEEKFCEYGCESGKCKGDPCAGVSCTTPPASFCSDATTKKVSVSPGTCNAGSCSYATADQKCPFGCSNGVCKDCAADTDCTGGGKFCDAGVCRACDGDLHCGASCTNCVTNAQVCSAGACVACVNDTQCGAGKFCENSTCKTCDTATKCGPSCAACGATTPTCAGGTTCSCTDTSCGANNKCTGGACAFCNTADSCGASCAPCGGTTPVCKTTGTASACVECTTNEQCGAGKTCTPDNKCVAGCLPPTDSCNNGGQNRRGCGNARIIGRKVAGSAAGATIKDDTCNEYNESDESSSVPDCYDAANDHHYRMYVRKGEAVQVRVVSGISCSYVDYTYWAPTLKLYVPKTCTNGVTSPYSGCGVRNFCNDEFDGKVKSYTATEDGWLVIVVDGNTAFSGEEDEGNYTLDVRLACSTGNCECP